MRKNFEKSIYLYELGLMIILFIFNVIFISSIMFTIKISITKYNVILALLFTLIFSNIYFFKKDEKAKLIILKDFLFLFIIIFSIFISCKTYDLSWDGNSYHKTAIGELKNGWNPNYETIENFNESDKNSLKLNDTHAIWNNHYAKGQWIFAANIYKVTNNIESGKCLNILLMITVFLILLSFLIVRINIILSLLISILVSFNPITIAQMFTFYNDQLIFNLVIIELIILQKIYSNKEIENTKINYLGLLLTLLILVNIKFTGIAYGGIIMLFYYIISLIKPNFRKKYIKNFTLIGILTVLVGICFIGYSTYIRNFIDHSNPLYPLFGKEKIDIMIMNEPRQFVEMNRIEKFIYANFSKTANITASQAENLSLKIPFTFSQEELELLSIPDLRIGGYGVLFGGILILSTIIISIGLYFIYFKDKKLFFRLGSVVFIIVFMILILDESWWARYLPQVYILPFIAIYILDKYRNKKINNILITLLLGLLIVNTGYFVKYNTQFNIERFKNIKNELSNLNDNCNYLIYTSDFNGAVYNIQDINKNIKTISSIKGHDKDKIIPVYNNMLNLILEDKKEN